MVDPASSKGYIFSNLVYLWDYDQKIVVQYGRFGECTRCGSCCMGGVHFSVTDAVDKDELRRGGQATTGVGKWMETRSNGVRTFFKMKPYQPGGKRCSHLGENQVCSIYSNRPPFCRGWPFLPTDITPFPNCTYQFQKLGQWSFEEIKIRKLEREPLAGK